LLVQDISAGFLPNDQGRAAAVQSVRDLQRMLLQKPTAPLRRLHMSPFRDSPFIGDIPAEEAFAVAEGRAWPIGAGSRGEAVRRRRQLWWQIADTAFRDSDNDAT